MPSKSSRTRGVRPTAPVASSAPPRRAEAVTPALEPQWATAEEIAWADAHGIDLSREVQAEHATGVRIAAGLIEQARQRRLRAIDRAIAKRSDWLSDLHQRGRRAAERTRQERREHRIGVTRTADKYRWQPVCSCGWTGRPTPTLRAAEHAAREERSYIFRRLSAAIEHTEITRSEPSAA